VLLFLFLARMLFGTLISLRLCTVKKLTAVQTVILLCNPKSYLKNIFIIANEGF